MNRIARHRAKVLTQEAKKLLAIAAWLETCAAKRTEGDTGRHMILQGQAEGLREAAGIIKSYIR